LLTRRPSKFTVRHIRTPAPYDDSVSAAQFAGAFRAEGPNPLPTASRQAASREEDPWLFGRWKFYGSVRSEFG